MQSTHPNVQAKRLRALLREQGVTLSHTAAQHLTAQSLGHPNWQALKAALDAPVEGRVLYGDDVITVTRHGNARAIAFTLTEGFSNTSSSDPDGEAPLDAPVRMEVTVHSGGCFVAHLAQNNGLNGTFEEGAHLMVEASYDTLRVHALTEDGEEIGDVDLWRGTMHRPGAIADAYDSARNVARQRAFPAEDFPAELLALDRALGLTAAQRAALICRLKRAEADAINARGQAAQLRALGKLALWGPDGTFTAQVQQRKERQAWRIIHRGVRAQLAEVARQGTPDQARAWLREAATFDPHGPQPTRSAP